MNTFPFVGFRESCLSPFGEHRFSNECRFVLLECDPDNPIPEEHRLCRKPSFYWVQKNQILPSCVDHIQSYIDVAKIWDRDLFRVQKDKN